MANLKEIRNRIASTESTKQITSAMKMVSASKLRRAQDKIINFRPYFKEMVTLVKQIFDNNPFDVESKFFEKRSGGKILIVAFSSNRGLCGPFNSSVAKYIDELLQSEEINDYHKNKKVDFICFGKKIADILTRQKKNIIDKNEKLIEKPEAGLIFQYFSDIFNRYLEGEWDKIVLVYNNFKNPASQQVGHDVILPLEKPEVEPQFFQPEIQFIYQPSLNEILDGLIINYLNSFVYKAFLESSAGEHGARMTAMHKATDNATELIKYLRLTYNKARQANITNEIIEIISGANALKKQ